MQAKTIYIAKNGREFDNREECERYERTLGTTEGTVEYLRKELEQLKQDGKVYMHGLLVVMHNNRRYIYTIVTTQGGIVTTTDDVVNWLEKFSAEDPIAVFYLASAHKDLSVYNMSCVAHPKAFEKQTTSY